MTSPVTLDVEGVPLKTTLRSDAEPARPRPTLVRDGLLMITKESVADPFRRIGHCYWALLMACFGGLAGRPSTIPTRAIRLLNDRGGQKLY